MANYVRDGDDPIDDPDLLAAVHAAFDRCLDGVREATEAAATTNAPEAWDALDENMSVAQLYVTVLERLGERRRPAPRPCRGPWRGRARGIRDRMRELEDEVRLLRS